MELMLEYEIRYPSCEEVSCPGCRWEHAQYTGRKKYYRDDVRITKDEYENLLKEVEIADGN
jgi:hypothetical protein